MDASSTNGILSTIEPRTFLRRAGRELRRSSFEDFFRYYFGHYITRAETPFQKSLYKTAQALAGRGVFRNIIGAKETAKSTIITLGAVIYAACYQLKHYMLVMGNPNVVDDHALSIVRELTTNERLLWDFGREISPKKDFKGGFESFRDEAVILRNDVKIRFLTPGQTARGTRHQTWRPDLFVGDDIHKRADFDSPMLLERQFRDVMGEAIGSLDLRRGSGIVLGNRSDEEGIQGRLARLPAWETERWPLVAEDGTHLGVTKEEAEAIRKRVGEYAWRTDFLCLPGDDGARLYDWDRFAKFSRADVKWKTQGDSAILFAVGSDLIENIVLALDPSRGYDRSRPRAERRGKPDRAALVCSARGGSGNLYIVGAEILEDDPDREEPFTTRQMWAAVRFCSLFSPNAFIVENNGFQEHLRLDIEQLFEAEGIPIRPMGETSSVRKETRIASMEPRIGQGRILYADDLPDEYQREWARFTIDGTRGPDDGMDGTEVSVRYNTASSGPAWSFGPSTGRRRMGRIER